MSEIVSKEQFFLESNASKALGKMGVGKHLEHEFMNFFDAICKAVLNGDNEIFAIQWAVSRLDDEESAVVRSGMEKMNGAH